jgi:glycoside/pentoside/hexuronide:cation symporter, GPH family
MIWDSAPAPSQGFLIMAIIFAVPITVSPLFPFFAWREPAVLPEHESKFFEDFKNALKSGHFRKGALIYISTWAGIGAVEAVLLYYFKYVVGLYDQFSLVAGVMFGVAILALPLWVFISKKLDKRKAFIIGASAFGALLCVLLLPAPAVIAVLWVIVPLLGIALSSLHVMPTAILPEAIEAVSGSVGGQGTNYGILSFIYTAINGLALWGVSGILSLSGYIESEENVFVAQPQSALDTIHIIIAAVPVILLVIGIIAAARLKISRQGIIDEKAEAGSKQEGASL